MRASWRKFAFRMLFGGVGFFNYLCISFRGNLIFIHFKLEKSYLGSL